MRVPLAIVGNGGAAAEAVLAAARQRIPRAISTCSPTTRTPPTTRCSGTYLVAGKIPLERAFPFGDGQAFYGANQVTAHLGEPVTRLDAEARELTTAAGESLRVRALPGRDRRPAGGAAHHRAARGAGVASGRRRPAPGVHPPDSRRRSGAEAGGGRAAGGGGAGDGGRRASGLRRAGAASRAAVVGASFAGVKIAAVLHDLGFEVSLVERETSILPLAAHPDAPASWRPTCWHEGYELRLGAAWRACGSPREQPRPRRARQDPPRLRRAARRRRPGRRRRHRLRGVGRPGRGGPAGGLHRQPSRR